MTGILAASLTQRCPDTISQAPPISNYLDRSQGPARLPRVVWTDPARYCRLGMGSGMAAVNTRAAPTPLRHAPPPFRAPVSPLLMGAKGR